jgi:CBS domain-containing protein
MTTLVDMLEETARHVCTTRPETSVLQAAAEMCRACVRALVVGDTGDPLGILCERDILERVLLAKLDPATTRVEQVMTAPLVSLHAGCTADEALDYIQRYGVHQVPVLGDEAIIGIVPATDLRRWALESREGAFSAYTS